MEADDKDILKCRKGTCDFRIHKALFSGHYVWCARCEHSAGIERTEGDAIATWNRWLLDDPRRKPQEA